MHSGGQLMPSKRRNIGKHFVLVPYFDEMANKVAEAEAKSTKQTIVVMERFAKINTPFRTGTNSRSIMSKALAKAGIVWTTSGYGFWLEVLDRVYERGFKGYMRGAFNAGKKEYLPFLKKAMADGTRIRPPLPRF